MTLESVNWLWMASAFVLFVIGCVMTFLWWRESRDHDRTLAEVERLKEEVSRLSTALHAIDGGE